MILRSLFVSVSFPLSLILFPSLPCSLSLARLRLLSISLSHVLSPSLSFSPLLCLFFVYSLTVFLHLTLTRYRSLTRSLASSLHVSLALSLFSLALLVSLAFLLSFGPSFLHVSLTRSLAITRFSSRSLTLSLPLFLPLSVSQHPSLQATPLRWIWALSVEACDIRINLNVQRSVLEFATLQYGIHSFTPSLYLPFCHSLSFSLSCSLAFSLATSLIPSPPHTSLFLLLSLPRTCGGLQRSVQTRVMSNSNLTDSDRVLQALVR